MTDKRRWGRWIQIAASVAVLAVLARDLDWTELRGVLDRASLGWLALALGTKGLGLGIHELRLWLCLPAPRPPALRVVVIGFVAGMMNLVLPARGGDLLAIALLHRECGVSGSAATAAVGLVAFLEAAVFGVFLMAVLVFGAARWEQILGAEAHGQAVLAVGGVTLAGVLGFVVITALARWVTRSGRTLPGPLRLMRDTATEAGAVLGSPARLAGHLALACGSVAAVVGAFTFGLPAVGLHLPFPWLAASGVLALSSVAAVALPPGLAAGPAAMSVAVLALWSVGRAEALAFGGAWWLISQVPAVALGLPGLWWVRWRGAGSVGL